MSDHHCHAKGCTKHVPPEMLMCHRHWPMVPAELKRPVWRHYRVGQCDDKRPSSAWLSAARDAICSVAEQEHARATRAGAAPANRSAKAAPAQAQTPAPAPAPQTAFDF